MNNMKILRVLLVIFMAVLAGRAFTANAQTETNLHSFVGPPSDGRDPRSGLVQGSDGNFYGTTFIGGTNFDGTVFRISPSGTYTSLYSFVGSPTDGARPSDKMVRGSDGNFYGTTHDGGMTNLGTVFRISPGGSYTNLYSFRGPPTDGAGPTAGLVQGSDGNFYGMTELGGTTNAICTNANGCGIVFRISPSGSYSNLYSFGSYTNDGQDPIGGLVQGSDSNFYGTTLFGGTTNVGTVFRISRSGSETNLYSFGSYTNDGFLPFAELVQGSDGNFYGTTYDGGTTWNGGTNSICTNGCGTAFRISPSGVYTSLYSFGIYPTDGTKPTVGLIQGSDGNFYGMTILGGTVNSGTIFRISSSGSYSNLYSFKGYPNDGGNPSEMVQGSDGNFYGTTGFGGTNNYGTVFKLISPLSSPANQISAINKAGTNIIVAIPSIAGETYQLQFSSSMTPTNWVNVSGVLVSNSMGGLLTLTNFGAASQPQRFYRFDITP